ncbi:MAG TPA: hypothetical protein VNN20_00240 [Thermodesulfobacteriota bacterium]|nr:hypothetical protein [Thermodesulfobacteriota bacterium]
MKTFLAVTALTITLMSTSSVFVHISYNLTAVPSSAESLNSYLVKREREFLDNLRLDRQEGFSNWGTSFVANENVVAFDLRLKRHCDAICPIAMAINRGGVKAVGMLMEKN